jgi:hypothetical protein
MKNLATEEKYALIVISAIVCAPLIITLVLVFL